MKLIDQSSRYLRLFLISLAPLLASPIAVAARAADPPRPNLVVILVDDMGYGDLRSYNPDSKIPTPHLDTLAQQGMRLTDAHAPGPLCHLSRYGLLTGRYPFRTDVGAWSKKPVIEEAQPTLPGLLQAAGYRTAMVGKWHLGFQENGYENPLPGGPVDRGFDTFFGIRASTDIPPYFYIRGSRAVQPPTEQIEANQSEGWSPIQGAFWRAGRIAPNLNLAEVLPRFTEEAIGVIENHAEAKREQPLMLYLAYPAPHTPWLPAEQFENKSGAGLYGDFMMMVDAEIGRILSVLEKAGMSNDTLVVFTSDNGPVWYDADVQRFGHDSAGGLRGMKADAWEAGHRMPFMVRWPGHIPPGSVSDQLVCFTDLMATLASILKVSLPAEAGPDSFDFSPELLGRTQQRITPQRETLVMQAGRGAMVIRQGPWKLINQLGSSGFSQPARVKPAEGGPQGQLYHLGHDLAETNNLWQQEPERVKRMLATLDRIRKAERSR